MSEEEHENFVHRLGNLTLLGEEYNVTAQNASFDIKKRLYVKSKIELTRNLSKCEEWGIEATKYGQGWLADLAVKVW